MEISTLSEHMFTECAGMKMVKKCPRCGEAVLENEFASHMARKQCKAHSKDPTMARCPLVSDDFLLIGISCPSYVLYSVVSLRYQRIG